MNENLCKTLDHFKGSMINNLRNCFDFLGTQPNGSYQPKILIIYLGILPDIENRNGSGQSYLNVMSSA